MLGWSTLVSGTLFTRTSKSMEQCNIAKGEIKPLAGAYHRANELGVHHQQQAAQAKDPAVKAYHEEQSRRAFAEELHLRKEAADEMMAKCGPIDTGHLAAINVALHNATKGELGMSVEKAKRVAKNGWGSH